MNRMFEGVDFKSKKNSFPLLWDDENFLKNPKLLSSDTISEKSGKRFGAKLKSFDFPPKGTPTYTILGITKIFLNKGVRYIFVFIKP